MQKTEQGHGFQNTTWQREVVLLRLYNVVMHHYENISSRESYSKKESCVSYRAIHKGDMAQQLHARLLEARDVRTVGCPPFHSHRPWVHHEHRTSLRLPHNASGSSHTLHYVWRSQPGSRGSVFEPGALTKQQQAMATSKKR